MRQKKVPIKLKENVYKTVIKPTMTYGAECLAVRKKDDNRLHVAETRMLRWIRGKTRKDHVRNQIMQEDAKVCQNVNIHEIEKIKLVWTHHEKRRRQPLKKNDAHGCSGEEKKGWPRCRSIDNTREDMKNMN